MWLLSYSFRRFQTCFKPLWTGHAFPYRCRISRYSCFPTVSKTVSGRFQARFRPLWSVHYYTLYYQRLFRNTKFTPVLLCTTLYYKVLLQYYSVLQSTTPALQSATPVLLRTTPVLQITTPVLHCITKYHSSITKLLRTTKYYSVLQSIAPYYKVLLCTTKSYSVLQSASPLLFRTSY